MNSECGIRRGCGPLRRFRTVCSAIAEQISEDLFHKHVSQCLDGLFLVRAFGDDAHARALGDAHGQNTKQALGIDLAVFDLDPDARLELVGLLDEVGCLPVEKTRFTLYDGLLQVQRRHSLYIMLIRDGDAIDFLILANFIEMSIII